MARRLLPRNPLALAILAVALPATARAELPGDFDPTFNGGQPVLLELSRADIERTQPAGVAFDAEGRILVTGMTLDEDGRPAVLLARLTSNGALDPSFGAGGSTVVQLGFGATDIVSFGFDVGPRAAGAGWLVAGAASTFGSAKRTALVAAFDVDGMIDVGFGTGGAARPSPAAGMQENAPSRGAIAADGAAYVAGTVFDDAQALFAVSKVKADGSLDMNFGNQPGQGSFVRNFADGSQLRSGAADLVVTPAGILVAGQALVPGRTATVVARLTSAGSLDLGFADGTGFFRGLLGDPALPNPVSLGDAVAVGPDAEIYAAGRALDANVFFALSVTRLSPNGALDATFATGGTRRTQLVPPPGGETYASDVVVQPDGKVVAVGSTVDLTQTLRQGVVLRLDVDGNLDPSFGDHGIVRVQLGTEDVITRVILSPDARSVVFTGTKSLAATESQGVVGRILLEPLATTTTLPGGCLAPPALDGARCRLAALGAGIDGALPEGKLRKRLDALVARAEGRLSAAASASGMALHRRLRKSLKPLRALGRLLASKPAVRALPAEQRAALAAQDEALVAEIQMLAEAG